MLERHGRIGDEDVSMRDDRNVAEAIDYGVIDIAEQLAGEHLTLGHHPTGHSHLLRDTLAEGPSVTWVGVEPSEATLATPASHQSISGCREVHCSVPDVHLTMVARNHHCDTRRH